MTESSVPTIYCINLDRSPDRWAYMMEQFQQRGLTYERITAIEGSSIASRLTAVAMPERLNEWKELLTPNAVGCALSHVKAYRRFLESDSQTAIFMEDDIEILDKFALLASNAAGMLPSGACALLYFHGEEKVFVEKGAFKLDADAFLYQAQTPWGEYTAGAYILDRAAAERLVAFNDPVYTTADSWGVFCREEAITRLYAVLPPVTAPAAFSSDIGYSARSKTGRWLERSFPQPFARWVRKLRANRVQLRYRIANEQPATIGAPER